MSKRAFKGLMAILMAVILLAGMLPVKAAAAEPFITGSGGAQLVGEPADVSTVTADPAAANSDITLKFSGTYGQTKARSMLSMVNDLRANDAWYWNSGDTAKVTADLDPYKYNYEVEAHAMQRAAELAVYYAHTRPDGTGCLVNSVSYAENIAIGIGAFTTAEEVFTAWAEADEPYAGQGHRRNMLSGYLNTIGIAYFSINGLNCWVQEFGISGNEGTKTAANDSLTQVSVHATTQFATIKSLTASPTSMTMEAGETKAVPKVSAVVTNTTFSGWEVDFDASAVVAWTSANSNIASVSGNNVTAKNEGTTQLTASAAGTTLKVPVTVEVTQTIDPNVTSVQYRTHVQSYGWQGYRYNGALSGTSGQGKRLEAINIALVNKEYSGGIEYRTHVQSYGWMDWVADGAMSGTSGQSKRLEAIQIRLTGDIANYYDVYYTVHAQKFGWLGWAKNGASAGTAGFAYRLEAIRIVLVPKGGAAPGTTAHPYFKNTARVQYKTQVQTYGWQDWVENGATSGTVGKSKRLEAILIQLADIPFSGSIEYRTHVQSYGWQGWVADGALSGTVGEGKRLEALEIRLTGNMAKYYDVYYRVHAQHFGWMGWAKNGESAGTSGFGYRLEGIEIKLVPKGGAAPGSTEDCYRAR